MKKFYISLVALLVATASFAQITLVEDINPGTGNSSPANLYSDGNYVYFAADDAGADVDHGKELWRTNGTTTEFIKDVRDGSSNSTPGNFFSLNSTIYFSAHNGSASVLHSTDGTEAGTVDLGLSYGLFYPINYNGKVYAVKTTESNALYEFDGTTSQRITNNSAIEENVVGGEMVVFGDKLLLYMKNNTEDADNIQGTEVGVELYEYDFTSQEYSLIKNISDDVLYPAEGEDVDINSSGISNMVVIGSKVYFEAESVLWETDGTTEGTVQVTGATSLTYVANFYVWNDKIYLEGDNGTDDDQLYVYDPADDSLTSLTYIQDSEGVAANHDPSDYATPGDGYLYYRGKNSAGTVHLFRTNGTTVEELYSDKDYYNFDELVVLDDVLYFEANDGTTGNELYSLDPATITTDDVVTDIEDEVFSTSEISVYPNPTTGVINIEGVESVDATYKVYDISGRLIKADLAGNQSISLDVAAGIYILEIKDGESVSTIKIQVR